MINSGAVQIINVQLDIQEAQNSANTLAETLETMARSLETIAQWDMSSIASELAEIEVTMDSIATLLGDHSGGRCHCHGGHDRKQYGRARGHCGCRFYEVLLGAGQGFIKLIANHRPGGYRLKSA